MRKNCQKLALIGFGGMGKTQVALKLAHIIWERWPVYLIFWVPAVSGESFAQAYRSIASYCSITLSPIKKDLKKSVQCYLSGKMAGKWLLIIENANDKEILFGKPNNRQGVTDYLPDNKDKLTLFITQYQHIAIILTGKKVVDF